MLAQQMARGGRPGTVTWLDRSAAALKVAQGRAAARGLTNIVWEQRSLLDLPGSGLGPFDYIDCCGVLHHLPDPAAGLRALLSVLAPGGGLGLMVYAPHGRTGVYMIQDALRLLAPPEQDPPARLDTARRVMKHLPETAWLRANRSVTDHLNGGDAGLYDLLLNPRDRAFTVPELHDFLARAGLGRLLGGTAALRSGAAAAGPQATGADRCAAGASASRAGGSARGQYRGAYRLLHPRRGGAGARRSVQPGRGADLPGDARRGNRQRHPAQPHVWSSGWMGCVCLSPVPPMAGAILRLIDGQRTVGEIGAMLAARGTGRGGVRAGLAGAVPRAGADQPAAARCAGWLGWICGCLCSQMAHDPGGGLIGRKEGLDREFGQRDVDRRAEHRGRAEERQRPVHGGELERNRHHLMIARLRPAGGTGRQRVIAHFLHQVGQEGVAADIDLLAQAVDDVVPPFDQVDDARGEAGRMQAEPDDVDRRRQQHRIDPGDQVPDRLVRRRHGPVPVDRQGRVRLMHRQDQVDALARDAEIGIVERPLLVGRRESGGAQEHIPVTQRNRQPVGQQQQHLPTRVSSPGLQETEMFRGDLGVAGEIQLASPAALTPLANQVSDGSGGSVHALSIQRRTV